MKTRSLAILLTALLLCAACGCAAGDYNIGEVREKMDASLFDVLDEDTRDFFLNYADGSAEFMKVNYDQHYAEVTVDDKALMGEMVEALGAIRVTAKTNISSTDGYHSVTFITADGTEYRISFENSVMCSGDNRYILENAEGFWNLFKTTAAEWSGEGDQA